MDVVAHRAGNRPESIAPAAASADAVELDVHLLRGRLEVRHSKAVWPFRLYWERGEGLLPDERPIDLAEIIAAAPSDTHLWIDLKGFTGRLARRALRELGDRRPLTMSCRSWWALGPARQAAGVRTFRSVGNRAQLWLALRLRHPDGIVINERLVTPVVFDRLRGRCTQVAVWGARDRTRVETLARLGVDAVILDDVDLAVRSTREPNRQ